MTRLPAFAISTGAALVLALTPGCSTDSSSTSEQTSSSPVDAPPITTTTATTEAPPPPPTDEQQIRDTLTAFQDAYNSQNWEAYQALMCPTMRERFSGSIMDSVRQTRANAGLTTTSVKSVTITDNTAVVTAENTNELTGTATVDLPLTRGDDGWALCMTY